MKKIIKFSWILTYIFFVGVGVGVGVHAKSAIKSDNTNSTSITITPLDNEHIKIEYAVGKTCNAINLLSPYQERTQLLRKDWRVLDGCGEVSTSGVLKQNKSCKTTSIAVPIKASIIDRVNPTAYPIGKDGVLVHTGTFAVDNSCGDVIWNFISPHGSVVVDGINRGESVKMNQSKEAFIKYTGVYFSYKKMKNERPIVVAKDVPIWLAQGIIDADSTLAKRFILTYPYLNFTAPALFVDNINTQARPSHQADVSSRRMARFGFFNYTDSDFEQNISNIKGISAHEYAHILQPKNLVEINAPFVSEGGAEFIRWITEYRLGWRNKDFMSKDFSNNLANCLSMLGDLPWRDVPLSKKNSGAFPYSCGFSMHVIALASRKNIENSEETLGNYYLQAETKPSTDFAQSLECGNNKNCKASWLPSLLTAQISGREHINAQLNNLGIVKNLSYGHDQNNSLLSRISFQELMIEDCGGVGFWTNQDHFLIDDNPNCRSLKKGLKISAVEGISYFTSPLKAMHAQYQACGSKHEVLLSTLDGQEIKTPCLKSTEPPKDYYEIDIDKLLSLLDRK